VAVSIAATSKAKLLIYFQIAHFYSGVILHGIRSAAEPLTRGARKPMIFWAAIVLDGRSSRQVDVTFFEPSTTRAADICALI